MRTFLRIFFVIFSSLVFHSCDKEDTIISNEISEGNAIKKFANAKEFESYLNNVDLPDLPMKTNFLTLNLQWRSLQKLCS